MLNITVGRIGDPQLTPRLMDEMFRLRHAVFHDELGWEVRSIGGREVDDYDDRDALYVLARDHRSQGLVASWRMRPTTRPHMLCDTFACLLDGPAPVAADIWEISRFAVAPQACRTTGYGFSDLTQDLIATGVELAARHRLRSYVWVTSVALERMGRRIGYPSRRLGPQARIGKVMSVASEVCIDAHTTEVARQRLSLGLVAAA